MYKWVSASVEMLEYATHRKYGQTQCTSSKVEDAISAIECLNLSNVMRKCAYDHCALKMTLT